ncbi:tyrosyl-DNA phosphodiesterase 2 [Heptranchias perlo]|uniref:tyrosyl-DNA phosphodiesterase 2 n=1 Tax=Heptranchias perlo TaxID=212740 RepID=UPI00355A5273
MSGPQSKRARLAGPDPHTAAAPPQEEPNDALGPPEEEKRRQGRVGLCAEFAVVTGTDEAVAQCYLAENDWLLEADYLAVHLIARLREFAVRKLAAAFPYVTTVTTHQKCSIGCKAFWDVLRSYSPDIVFLQEVIPPYYKYLKKRAVSYTIITANEEEYYTAIMLKKSRVKLLKQEITPFPTSSMMRNLLTVQVNIAGNELCLMTSHLESTKAHSEERMRQLGIVLKKIKEAPECATVIFGGDTNLRDQEVTKVGGLPAGILDVWEFLNKPEHCQYTWDTKMNNNLKARYSCRLRFDRLFFRAASEGQIVPKQMDLLGLDKLECGRFCSDHWGLLCDFDVIL